ncbi:MAG: DUF5362 domain-containing protein [Nitrospirota bacterium]|nr:MAG: DUF5362 domain-containing protein [Nitrospirota bacterium]
MEMQEQAMSQLRKISDPLYKVKGWIKFAGIMTIISGALQILSIWGILIAWLPIWMGVLLVSSSNLLTKAYESESDEDMVMSFGKLGTYFKIFGIFMVVLIAVMILGILAAILIPTIIGMQQSGVGVQ